MNDEAKIAKLKAGVVAARERLYQNPKPLIEWPMWARAMKQFTKPEDNGIGDIVARMIGDENSAAFKAFYLKITGKTCGCSGRQSKWNQMYPLEHASS